MRLRVISVVFFSDGSIARHANGREPRANAALEAVGLSLRGGLVTHSPDSDALAIRALTAYDDAVIPR